MTALVTICQVMAQRVNPSRLNLPQCVELACARATPVARLGLTWLAGRPVATPDDRTSLARLANAQCEAVGVDAAKYALSILGAHENYALTNVSPFFDSLNPQVRQGAWEWLTPESAGYDDPLLWLRLLETPYDDVRLPLIGELSRRTRGNKGPQSLQRQDLSPVWATVLLNVHRGGRAKLLALRQISEAIAEQPDRAEQLIPVLAVAIRSVRLPEARAGLAAILSAVAVRPELQTSLAQHIPELRLVPLGEAT